MTQDKTEYIDSFAARFNKALDHNGLPPRNHGRIQLVAEMFLLSHAGAGKWVNGLALPPKARRREISQRLGVQYDWLEFGKGEMLPKKLDISTSLRRLPILGFHEAANFEKHLENFIGETVSIDINAGRRAFVIYSQGTAMSGRFPEGSMLIFDPDVYPQDGDYVLAKIHKLPDAIFRQYILSDSGKFLYAQDPRFQTHKMSANDLILAKMIQHRMNY
ncbi:MAG: putative prophage repressor [Gammaproteobacteria bacterium]|jgi:SOS-response transcriptional repressor LexA|nr:putative prophage repressor [Gammaproteobacteria bacterium]